MITEQICFCLSAFSCQWRGSIEFSLIIAQPQSQIYFYINCTQFVILILNAIKRGLQQIMNQNIFIFIFTVFQNHILKQALRYYFVFLFNVQHVLLMMNTTT